MVIDDRRMVRDLVSEAVSKKPGLKAVGIGMSDPDEMEQAFSSFYDVVLMNIDTSTFNAVEAIQTIQSLQPATRIIVLTSNSKLPYLSQIFESGAVGFIDIREAFSTVIEGIRMVLKQKLFISPGIRQRFMNPTDVSHHDKSVEELSMRQREILKLLAQGKQAEEIAFALNLSVSTVHLDRRKMIVKLGMDSVTDLTKYAIRKGLISSYNRYPSHPTGQEICLSPSVHEDKATKNE